MNLVEGAQAGFTGCELTHLLAETQMMHILFWDFSVKGNNQNMVVK